MQVQRENQPSHFLRVQSLLREKRSLLLLNFTEVPLLLWDVPLSTFVSVGSALAKTQTGGRL